jgi:hypothetical protein
MHRRSEGGMMNLRTTLREHRTDILVCLLLAASSVIYLMLRRWPLGAADEAYYFYHAIRMLEGEVLYRDVFELTTPFYIDLLALAFHLFGSSFTTGRVVGSVIQALLVVAIYSGVRAVGAGRALAVAAASVQLAIAQPAWPYATPHWLAVLLVCVLLIISLNRQRARTAGWIVTQGLLLGLLIATRQHAGVAVGLGMTLLALVDAVDDRLWGRAPGQPLGRHLITLAVSTLAGFGLVIGPHLMQAGISPIINQLIIHPLTGYRAINKGTWGVDYLFNLQPFTWPALLKYLPVVVAVTALRAIITMLRRYDRRSVESLLVLAVFGASAIAYTMSFPDLVHLAMIMPVTLIVTSELLMSALRMIGRWERVVQTTLALTVILACAAQLQRNYVNALAEYPIMHDTQFGRLPFATLDEIETLEWVKSEVQQSSSRELFSYPGWSAMYLMSGARNPTRHELIFPTYQSDKEVQDVIETLERERVGHVLLVVLLIKPDDPVYSYVTRHYRCSSENPIIQLCARNEGE